MAYLEKCGIRFCKNNWLTDTGVVVSSETDYNTSTLSEITNSRDFGIYRLTKDPTSDFFIIDITLPTSLEPTTFALLPVNYNTFFLTNETTVEVEASNLGFDHIQKTFQGRFSRFGVFCDFVEPNVQNSFRYWRIKISTGNRANFDETLDLKYAYFGDHLTIKTRNIAAGFNVNLVDNSEAFKSDSNRLYWNEKDKQISINGLRFQYMNNEDKLNFQQFIYCVGVTKNFLTILDPTGFTESENMELMRVMSFDKIPGMGHKKNDFFEFSYNLSEAL